MELRIFTRMAYSFPILATLTFICIILLCTETVSIFVECYSVDSSGCVYVGKYSKICVYEGESEIRAFGIKSDAGYHFTVTEQDTILLASGSDVYEMDLQGNVMGKHNDTGTYYELRGYDRCFDAPDGNQYSLRGKWGWTRIIKNGEEVVYQISTLSFIVKILLYLIVACFIIVTLMTLVDGLKYHNNT